MTDVPGGTPMTIDDTQPPGTDTAADPADKAELERRVEEKTEAVQAATASDEAPAPAKKAARKAAKKAPATAATDTPAKKTAAKRAPARKATTDADPGQPGLTTETAVEAGGAPGETAPAAKK